MVLSQVPSIAVPHWQSRRKAEILLHDVNDRFHVMLAGQGGQVRHVH